MNIKIKKRKTIKNKQFILNQQIKTSILVYLILHIFFFPFYFIAWYFKMLKINTKKFLLINGITFGCILLYLSICYITLPDINKLYNYKPVLSSKFYDRNDELIFEVGNERRTHIDINDVPKLLIYAFISAEDKTFYTNPGFDIYGMAKTIFKDIHKFARGQRLAGASTITQQVVKNVLLTNERTISRKLKEFILSYRIAKTMPKDKVMEVYLNHIYLGMQAYGIVSASEEYFGKTVLQLTVPEMALLAAMPKAPSSINPFKNYNRSLLRRNYVLQRMMEDGYITPAQYEEYASAPIVVKRKYNFYSPFYAPAFLAQSLLTSKETGLTKDNILNDGYKVKLTIDGELQKIAQEALNHSLEDYSKKHGYTGALFTFSEADVYSKKPIDLLRTIDEPENINKFLLAVVLKVDDKEVTIGLKDNSTGKILLDDLQWARPKISETEISMTRIEKCSDVLKVGDVIIVDRKTENSNYYTLEQLPQINGGVLILAPKTGEILAMIGGYADLAGSFNRTVQAFRQMGSTIKPFVYATALENNYTPASIFMDADININLGDGVVWQPANDSKTTSGPTTLRIGLERSRNTVTIRLAEAVGISKIRKKIIQAGINKNPENNLSTAIGSVESSLLNIATAYSAFINNGKPITPYLISYVKNILDKNNSNEENDDTETTNNEDNNVLLGKIYFTNCDLNAKCEIRIGDKTDQEEKLIDNNTETSNNKTTDNQQIDQDDTSININNETEQDNTSLTPLVKDTKNTKNNQTLFTPETSYQILNILQGAVKRGTSRKLEALGLPIASKTGTSNGGKDMWNIVLSPELLIVTFVGYDIPTETNNYGAQYALPISREILSKIGDKYNISDFKTPDGIKFVKINRLTGKAVNDESDERDVIFEAFKENDEIDIDDVNIGEDIDITDIH